MPDMPVHEATAVLRGHRGPVTVDQCRDAAAVLIDERDQLILVAMWAERLLQADDDAAAARARRRLTEALARWQ